MDPFEQWLREQAKRNTLVNPNDLADEWLDNPAVTTVPYDPPNPLADFLSSVEGPAMIGLDPMIYPACARCGQAWKLTRSKGVWSWSSDCNHKTATCKLVKGP